MNLNVTSNVNQSILPCKEALDLSCRSNRMTENVRMNPDSLRPLIHTVSDQYSPLPDWRIIITNPKISSTVTAGMLNDPTFQALSVSASRDTNNRKKTDKKVKVDFCEICGKGFGEKSNLARHMNIHTREKLYSCEVCNKKFRDRSNLKRHTKNHTKESFYFCEVCEVCGKGFKRKDTFELHIKIHAGDRAYPCIFCSKRFITTSNLNQHIQHHHIKGAGKKDKPCEICDRILAKSSSLKAHMRTHTGEKPYSCEVCGRMFGSKYRLQGHMIIHTEKKTIPAGSAARGSQRSIASNCI